MFGAKWHWVEKGKLSRLGGFIFLRYVPHRFYLCIVRSCCWLCVQWGLGRSDTLAKTIVQAKFTAAIGGGKLTPHRVGGP
jgi:hypothetical protein